MNIRILAALVVAGTIAAPAVAAPALTRAQVQAELAQLRAAGYDQSVGENANYPVGIQAAEARIAAQNSGSGAYGSDAPDGTYAAGAPKVARHPRHDDTRSIYSGH